MNAAGNPAVDALPEQSRCLLAGAWGFYFTAQLAEAGFTNSAEQQPDLRPAILVNVGYAYELSLKAFLAANGQDDRRLREIGHKLNCALSEAITLGLPENSDVAEQVRLIGPAFANHSLRYISFENQELPTYPVKFLRDHLDSVSCRLLFATD